MLEKEVEIFHWDAPFDKNQKYVLAITEEIRVNLQFKEGVMKVSAMEKTD